MKRIFALTILLTACVSIEYPEPKEHKRPLSVNIDADCELTPGDMGVIYWMVTEDNKIPSAACEKPSKGCAIMKGNKAYIYFVPSLDIAVEEYLHAIGCMEHAD